MEDEVGGLLSDHMEIWLSFQAVAVVLATLGLYTGMYHINNKKKKNLKESPRKNIFSESDLDLLWTPVVSVMRSVWTQKNFRLFLIMNFLQVSHGAFFSNFVMIFAEAHYQRGRSFSTCGA
ncbi:uncharacterized protein V5649_016396 [Rhynchonycteris naso]